MGPWRPCTVSPSMPTKAKLPSSSAPTVPARPRRSGRYVRWFRQLASITFDGTALGGKTTTDIARLGVAHVPQGRGTFADLSVEENLEVGAFRRKDRNLRSDYDFWYGIFPRLGERRTQLAGSLSGGEQQMLAVARAMMSKPKLLLLDEPSLGLAPIIVRDLFDRLSAIQKEQNVTMLVVEQNANLALKIADRAYVLEAGEIAMSGSAEELRNDDGVRRAYLGF